MAFPRDLSRSIPVNIKLAQALEALALPDTAGAQNPGEPAREPTMYSMEAASLLRPYLLDVYKRQIRPAGGEELPGRTAACAFDERNFKKICSNPLRLQNKCTMIDMSSKDADCIYVKKRGRAPAQVRPVCTDRPAKRRDVG